MSDEHKKELEWTGERYVPQIPGNIRLEHLHRYLIAKQLTHGKRVLDIACGEGYGSDVLATVAAHVVGVDSAHDAITHASARYTRPNLEFKHGACEAIPLPDQSVDVVVSFETIEHVRSHDGMMREICRVLATGGLLVISSPDRHEYSEVLGNNNTYHVSELYGEEFEQLLRSYFPNVAVGGQRVRGGSIVGPLSNSTDMSFVSFPFTTDFNGDLESIQGVQAPVYLVALASSQPLPPLPVGLLDGGDFLWMSDLPGIISQIQGQCAEDIAGRLGEAVQLEGADSETNRLNFVHQAERVSAAIALLGAHQQKAEQAQRRTAELDPLTTTLIAELQYARSHAETIGKQFLEANAKLLAAYADLTTSRAFSKAHAATEEWLERRARNLETELEAQRRASDDREAALARDLAAARERLVVEAAAARENVERLHSVIAALNAQVQSLHAHVQTYEQSRSWRLTAPLRAVRRGGRAVPPTPSDTFGLSAGQETPVKADATVAASVHTPSPPPSEAVLKHETGGPDARSSGVIPAWAYDEPTSDYVGLERSTPVETRIRLIAFYLPQFHPIPENDQWWGKGFTEWTSVTRAKPQFEGHYQPHLPGELGFYDLRLPEVQRRQVELARLHGVHGFCFYHYWFHGRKLLERPFQQFLASDIDFPFCLCWANENWTRRWDGLDDEWLMVQQHSAEDDLEFIRDIEPALRDRRCIKLEGRPLLLVYRPALFPDARATAERWRAYCREVGIGDLYLMSTHAFDNMNPRHFGFDAALEFVPNTMATASIAHEVAHLNPDFRGHVFDYRARAELALSREKPGDYPFFRSVMPMWDNEPRRPGRGTVFARSSPALYRNWLESTCRWTERQPDIETPLVFVNAWNEWGEGAHLEPDRRHGYAYLEATAEALEQFPPHGKRPSIVVVSHDAHLYGAQLIALNLVRTLSTRLHFDVDVILCGPGTLKGEFAAAARVHDVSDLAEPDRRGIVQRLYDEGGRLAICNTSVVGETAEQLKQAGFFVISLIHELPGLIRAYGLERSIQRIATHADYLVFPAKLVRDRIMPLTERGLDRVVVQAQGLFAPNGFFGRREFARRELRTQLKLPAEARIVLAVGSADHRKGIDLFVEVGRLVCTQMQDVVFVWVGQTNTADFASAREKVERVGLGNRFLFPGQVRNSNLFFAGADAYVLTSREDPFPSVVLEALDASLPIIGFDGAGGFVELLERGCGILVPFEDTAAMAESLLRILRSPDQVEPLVKVGREILSTEFSFVNYARTLAELAEGRRPTVSVIVPNYNYARYLPERLRSIIDQTYPPFEILFLDDCSSDNSVQIAEEMLHASGLSYRIIANQTNQGTYRQWLRGIREAKGDLLWIAEADDHCAPGLLESLVRQFDNPEVVLAYCQSRQIDEVGTELAPDYLAWTADISETKWREKYVRSGVEEICDTLAVKNTIPNVSAVLMRRIDLSGIEHKLVTLRNAGDWLLYVYLLEHGSIAFVPDVLNSHRRHASSVTIGGNGLNLMREILIVQQHVKQRHPVTLDAEQKRETDRQRTYEYLGLSSAGPASYKEHEALRDVEWVAPR
jgi:glycosyltransferase involved in cell wall biosynthesis/SAM-dependent methyltransferase